MVNSLLFRWEDSQALQHHCGFCERPLSHPGARASCFGTHSEPCHRFHQTMFMRLRAHMCNYCQTIDEAHYKRHHEIIVQLRSIYESCGEVDWTVVPTEPGDPRRDRPIDPQSANSESSDRSLTPEDTPTSKRERKNAKCLARAASRPRVVTQEEIRYIDSVLHTTEGRTGSESADPANLEEMQLIETHLRYNANVYNSHSSRRDLQKFATIPDVDVDFDGEMERVLDTFRITELVKRNLKNRGLQGKELKDFETSVDTFKATVVEDLILVKKDVMEVRMRRAGYLRYTNKTAYGIVEERYTDKDWKTGERITSSSSDSSSLTTPSDDFAMQPIQAPDAAALPASSSTRGPDRRHLEHIHTRVSGDDGLGQKVIEPYHAPLLPLTPNAMPKRPAFLQLKVVENKENKIPAGLTNRGWLRRDVARQAFPSQPQYNLEEKASPPSPPSPPSTKPATSSRPDPITKSVWSRTATCGFPPQGQHSHPIKRPALDGQDLPALGPLMGAFKPVSTRSSAPAVQAPTDEEHMSLKGPERVLTPEIGVEEAHPIVSQKKAKKAQREAKRKAKKVNDSEETSSPIASDDVGCDEVVQALCEVTSSVSLVNEAEETMDETTLHYYAPESGVLNSNKDDAGGAYSPAAASQTNVPDTPAASPLPIVPCTTHGKHDHWTRFSRVFVVDQLTVPLLQSWEGCSHGSSCQFESHRVPDCPFHEPHCSCVDPLRDQCVLVYPGKKPHTAGPYNRAHGERLMAKYQHNDETKGRVMLVDSDLVSYFLDCTNTPSKPDPASMPHRLLREHKDYQDGYERGPLMKQVLDFERMFVKNMAMRHPLTMRMLRDIVRQKAAPNSQNSVTLCYCSAEILKSSDIDKELSKGVVLCSYRKCEFGGVFHKRCVKKLGVEKVSRWYCTACQKEMKALAYKTLNIAHADDGAIMNRAETIAEMIGKPGGAMDRFKSRLQEMYTNELDDDLEVENMD